jgi:hypothetical protein
MKKLLFITAIIIFFNSLSGQQPVGSWTDNLNYNTAKSIAAGTDEIYVSTGSSVLVYNKEYSELKKLSPVNGLSETGISSIGWSDENKILVIAYKSTNLDLVLKNTVYNIPDIMNKYIPGNKRINRIRTLGKFAYLATGFGIVVVDVVKMEIYDTWKPGPGPDNNEVFDIAFGNNMYYAVTALGTWYADQANTGLAYFGNWTQIKSLPDPDSRCNHVVFSGGTLYVNVPEESSGDKVYAINDGTRLHSFYPDVTNTSFDLAPEGFTVSSPGSLNYYSDNGALRTSITSYGWGSPNISQGIVLNNDVWISDISYGLIYGKNMSAYTSYNINGPVSNHVVNITSSNGKTIICGGGTDDSWNSLNRPLQVSVSEDSRFTIIDSGTYGDAMRSLIDPGNSSHFFISSWGDGLFEFNNNTLIKHYDATNSPLGNGATTGSGVRICGLAMDRSKNLWITQTDVPESIKILKPDGTWIIYPQKINSQVIGDIISTVSGQKWIILPVGHGLFIIDDNNTPDMSSDDQFRKLTVIDSDNNIITTVFSAAEDLEGNIWIGTDQGPVIYTRTARIFDDDVRGFRIKVPRNDGSGLADYMLGTESITSIAVDGANRKWLGTSNSGAYLLSADGTVMLKNYNEHNSSLFSDSIATVAIDNITGEVWFGTSEGVISVREIATSGKEEYKNVYSFPNPVREDFTGNVTITGLIKDTQIKITDISGNLVFETLSEGGQASWDLKTYNGQRVATGVYLVFCANNDGSKSCVTKVLVIGK